MSQACQASSSGACSMMNHLRKYRLFYYALAVAFLIGRSVRSCSHDGPHHISSTSIAVEARILAG